MVPIWKFAGKSYCGEDHLNKFPFLAQKKEKLKKTKGTFIVLNGWH